ncbi:ABC transporter permease [Puniceicoccus vermicola]|uniref:ABC transporter permease n=1 Tax=Puniceicoccus vermicola TaxID=388746 RepID=A0A7X1AZ32_9BACT|nr:ABC transporter permease [Puniceicoccus vermicola]MBC2602552.1 ABC transporter permease [Puniceicoccus vermicola]
MLGNAFLIAIREIRRNLTRTFLTVLGIIIGVSAVITMVTMGEGTTQAVKDEISQLGSNLLVLSPGVGFGPRSSEAGVPNFTLEDVRAIRTQIPGVAAVAPIRGASLSTIYRQEARKSQVVGTSPEYFFINKWVVGEGRIFTEGEAERGDAVAVIGNTVRQKLFGSEDPIGKKIRLGQASLQVVGLLATKGRIGMEDQDDIIVVPLATMQRRLGGRGSSRDITDITISAIDDSDGDQLIAEITQLMRQRRNLQWNQDDNFSVFDTRQIAETLSASTKMMTMLLGAVAGVSLLVGGIGIMNIMLVSVTERTREIGIRLAIGATAREVLWQFMVEALTLSCVGGLVGIGLAFLFCSVLAPIIEVGFLFNLQINLIAFVFSAVVGVVFGFAPARRAAGLDPIDALRHE